MKKIFQLILCGAVLAGAASCNKYLDIVPKGQKIPQTFEDYKALLGSTKAHTFDFTSQAVVANEWYTIQTAQATQSFAMINYNWKEGIDRLQYVLTDMTYSDAYAAIFVYNVLINHVASATTGTATQKAELIAQARVCRALHYFNLVNTYAKTYNPSTAATDPGVMINVNDDMEQTLNQSSVKEVYDFVIREATQTIQDLPVTSMNGYYATKGAAYALLARVYMFQRDYAKAAEAADNALKQNNTLFDYVKYYNDNKTLADGNSPGINVPLIDFSNPENYVFNHGGGTNQSQGYYITGYLKASDSVLYDKGDARLKVNFAVRTVSSEAILSYRRNDKPNMSGLRTPEVYYIKAECLARAGNMQEAMEVLNTVRRKRIITAFYSDVTATTEAEAIAKIRREMRCEYRGAGMMYLDYRRFNMDPVYKTTLTKTEGTTTYSIAPDSYIWIMPFSATSIAYGEGRLVQNSK
ncbi:RagB/SusD family nutrient uptake outer membrane protein [Chitinophaga sp. Cy-1792]|uniref:RagB/SusD family nutrient uptake outer membrane protein n=1 Tax=Chitinophaga sp. Cy-1792 TaxID=2608339 RepID=UPI00142010A3|nr:RagB/SusD family nutrient uptake outer membrane protein [Chitinophaga sp. Cy-1792]NIG53095.1 RagB/SusD family nutrient uptake outer membrane protein [Chitinophaga sp. Cy-1792]